MGAAAHIESSTRACLTPSNSTATPGLCHAPLVVAVDATTFVSHPVALRAEAAGMGVGASGGTGAGAGAGGGAEAVLRDADVGAWQGFMGPKGVAPEIVRALNGHFNEILKMPDVLARMNTLALIPVGGEAAAIGRINAADHARYARVIKEFGIQAE